ncbi:MAG: hypothetical protein HC888_04710 [Candidatus Competibacteraceae bacterium]|nr:hypothetical protein [Candidatus Competibacteraceae bacterium]
MVDELKILIPEYLLSCVSDLDIVVLILSLTVFLLFTERSENQQETRHRDEWAKYAAKKRSIEDSHFLIKQTVVPNDVENRVEG